MKTRTALVGLGLGLAGAVTLHTLTNVTHKDVIAYHKLDREVSASAIAAGDIVAISPDGLRMERICALGSPGDNLERTPIDAVYVNELGDHLGGFVAILKAFTGGGGAASDELRFVGAMSGLREVTAAKEIARDCECEMARRLNARQPVCTAKATLVETVVNSYTGERASRTRAVTFANFSNQVPADVFEQCGLEVSPAAEETQWAPCAASASPWDVKLRKGMNLIEERPAASAVEARAMTRPVVPASPAPL